MQTVRDHVLNDQMVTTRPFFHGFYSIEQRVFHFQCSEHTSGSEIETMFNNAIYRQNTAGASRRTNAHTMCVVFLDEAGLPEEAME